MTTIHTSKSAKSGSKGAKGATARAGKPVVDLSQFRSQVTATATAIGRANTKRQDVADAMLEAMERAGNVERVTAGALMKRVYKLDKIGAKADMDASAMARYNACHAICLALDTLLADDHAELLPAKRTGGKGKEEGKGDSDSEATPAPVSIDELVEFIRDRFSRDARKEIAARLTA